MSRGKKIVLILLLCLIATPFIYVEVNKSIYAERVIRYLMEEKGFEKDEIRSVTGVWGIKLPPFYAVVKFADEPGVEYIYFAHDGVHQFSHNITDEGRESGVTDAALKHVER